MLNERKLVDNIEQIRIELKKLLESYQFGRIIRDGVNVALVGKPNVGKSSLLNYLLKESRAIVSHIPGTTRDIIREEISIDGILFRLFDTAGLRTTSDVLEKEGVERSREAVRNADIVLFINEVGEEMDQALYQSLTQLTDEINIVVVLNKIDLDGASCEKNVTHQLSLKTGKKIRVSAKTGEGIQELCQFLHQKALGQNSYTEHSAVVSNVRHYNNLLKANKSLQQALQSIQNQLSGEFIALDLRDAENALGEIIGAVTTDDILNNIFSRFCIGK